MGAADEDEVRCRAQAGRSPPPKSEPVAAAKTSERPRRMAPSTPDACAAPKPTSVCPFESLKTCRNASIALVMVVLIPAWQKQPLEAAFEDLVGMDEAAAAGGNACEANGA